MYPHSELDNYKLQVQLLHEKLKRSEENRKKVENKLEKAIQKKTEHEKIVRAKQRQKYEDFIGQLEKRNEQNRQLIKMLERVDQQTAALSARSERLKTMKMQHEIYFAKLMQSQAMRCIQRNMPAATTATAATTFLPVTPTSIPVLLPTPLSTLPVGSTPTATPIKNDEVKTTTATATATTAATAPATAIPAMMVAPPGAMPNATAIYHCDANGNLIVTGTPSNPVAYTPYYVATATTDYMQYPFGFLPSTHMRRLLRAKPDSSISDESDDLQQPLAANKISDHPSNKNIDSDNNYMYNNIHERDRNRIRDRDRDRNGDIENSSRLDLPIRHFDNEKKWFEKTSPQLLSSTTTANRTTPNLVTLRRDNERHAVAEQLLSDMSPTFSSTRTLTLDKLPNIVDRNNDADDIDDIGSGRVGMNKESKLSTYFDEFSKGKNSVIDCDEDKGALQTRRNEEEKLLSNDAAFVTTSAAATASTADVAAITTTAAAAAPTTSNDNDNNSIQANLRQKIDSTMPWQQQMTQTWQKVENSVVAPITIHTTSGIKDNTPKFEEMTAGFSEYTIQNEIPNCGIKSDDKILPTTATTTTAPPQTTISTTTTAPNTPTLQSLPTGPKMSFEKIENEIYGELVNPPLSTTDKVDARHAAQGLVKELVTKQQQQDNREQQEVQEKPLTPEKFENYEQVPIEAIANEYTNYEYTEPNNSTLSYEQSTSESYDPTYATIEGTTNAEVYPTATMQGDYVGDPNSTTGYADYSTDPAATQQQAEYANVDYSNYEATQFTTSENYDPNVYPGYTYDQTTGQYTPNQQYNTDPQYAAADVTTPYDPQAVYDPQMYDNSEQQQNYDYNNYEPGNEQNIPETPIPSPAAVVTPQTDEQSTSEAQPAETAAVTTAAPTVSSNKPTSILSSADKHATNEAQKKKKRVNFVDSSETDDSSSVKQATPSGGGNEVNAGNGGNSESDFDFSSSDKSGGA